MSQKSSKKIRQLYNRGIRNEVDRFMRNISERDLVLQKYIKPSPKLIPNKLWQWLIDKVFYI